MRLNNINMNVVQMAAGSWQLTSNIRQQATGNWLLGTGCLQSSGGRKLLSSKPGKLQHSKAAGGKR